MSTIFGGGTTTASEQSQAAQVSANAATQRFIERQSAQARADVREIFPQAQQLGAEGFQGALDVIGGGLPQRLSAFQQGNVGAQQITGDTLSQVQNAILGLPVDQGAFAPQTIGTDLSFLSDLRAPGLAQEGPLSALDQPAGAVTPPPVASPLFSQPQIPGFPSGFTPSIPFGANPNQFLNNPDNFIALTADRTGGGGKHFSTGPTTICTGPTTTFTSKLAQSNWGRSG